MNIENLYHKLDEPVVPTAFVGGIFPRKHVSIIASKAGVGKTWYLLKLIVDLSKGGTIFNSQAYFEPPRKCIMFCGETGIQLILERQAQMRDQPKIDNIVVISKLEAAKQQVFLNLNTQEGAQAIFNLCKPFAPDLVIFDTLMSFRDDDENGAQDTSVLMMRLQAIAETLDCAIIITHHLRKSQAARTDDGFGTQRVDQDEIIGSSALVRQCGVAYILLRFGDEFILRPVKTWWAEPKATTYLMTVDEGKVEFEDADPTKSSMSVRMKVEGYILSCETTEQFTVADLMQKFNANRSTVARVIARYCEKVGDTGGKNPSVIYHRKSLL